MSTSIQYSQKEISIVVLDNILKMLERRSLINNYTEIFNGNKEIFTNKGIIEFNGINKKISINLYTAKISSIAQGSQLDDYLKNNTNIYKFIIMKDSTKRIVKQILTEYINAEFFFEHEMMEDIPSKLFIPEHTLLTEDEKKEFLNIFKENELAKINDTDMMSRYYGAKLNDIFKIVRPSLTAGRNIFYRKVIPGNIAQLFDS